LNFVNFHYYEHFTSKYPALRHKVSLVGDPVPQPSTTLTKPAARRLLGLDPDGTYLGLIGSLDERKAIPLLLDAFAMAEFGPTCRLLLAGRLDGRFATLIRDKYSRLVSENRIVVINRFLSDDEISLGYFAVDVATPLYYDHPGVASLQLKAMAAGRPCIVNDLGWSAEVVRRFDCGHVTKVNDLDHIAATMRRSLESSESFTLTPPARRFLEFHSPENFVDRMLAEVRRLCHQDKAKPPITWQQVNQG
jgi:glycosyltransferase involved in cell wall biosynthesis